MNKSYFRVHVSKTHISLEFPKVYTFYISLCIVLFLSLTYTQSLPCISFLFRTVEKGTFIYFESMHKLKSSFIS